jgi:hypothetical protein
MSSTRPRNDGKDPGKGAGAKDGKEAARNSSEALQHIIERLAALDGD